VGETVTEGLMESFPSTTFFSFSSLSSVGSLPSVCVCVTRVFLPLLAVFDRSIIRSSLFSSRLVCGWGWGGWGRDPPISLQPDLLELSVTPQSPKKDISFLLEEESPSFFGTRGTTVWLSRSLLRFFGPLPERMMRGCSCSLVFSQRGSFPLPFSRFSFAVSLPFPSLSFHGTCERVGG